MSDSTSVIVLIPSSDGSEYSDSESEPPLISITEENSSSEHDPEEDAVCRTREKSQIQITIPEPNPPPPAKTVTPLELPTESVELLDWILTAEELAESIFELLPFRTILECSLVSRSWLQSTRNYLRNYTWSAMTVTLKTESSSFMKFANVMRGCQLYPVSSLRIRMGSRSETEHKCSLTRIPSFDALKLLLSRTKELRVRCLSVRDKTMKHDNDCELFKLLQALIGRLSGPDVKYLRAGVHYFSSIFTRTDRATLFWSRPRQEFIFPNLEFFKSITDHMEQRLAFNWGREALEAKLKAFHSPVTSPQLYFAFQGGTLHALKYCHLFGHARLVDVERLAEAKPGLISLALYGVGSPENPENFIPNTTLTLIHVLNELLQSSHETLVELRTNLPMLNAMCQNCNSVLENLKILDLHYDSGEMLLLSSIDFERISPNLLTVFLRAHYRHSTRDLLPAIFWETDYLELVPSATARNLIVQLNIEGVGNSGESLEFMFWELELLGRAFPFLENLSIHNNMGRQWSHVVDFPVTLKALMRVPWPELKRLEIVTGTHFRYLEHVIVGVRAVESKYWRTLKLNEQLKDLQFAPSAPSLQNFPKLKLFKFTPRSSEEVKGRLPTRVYNNTQSLSSLVYELEYDSEELTTTDDSDEQPFTCYWQSEDSSSQTSSETYITDYVFCSRIPGLEFRYD